MEHKYKTSSLALAAAIALYLPLDQVDKNNPTKAIFTFKESEKLQDVVTKYFRGELRVEPQAYFDRIKLLKTLLYQV